MEDTLKDQTSVSGTKVGKSAKLLRYPLRSASKPKDDKLPASSPSVASGSRRGKATSSVSQSVSVLDVSGKEKSAKPPRRLSIPSKPTASPATKSAGYITPISEARGNRSAVFKGKTETPGSDVSRSLNRRKFTVLSSPSYWLSHIKLSEAASKHQVSLGFFKLALEAGCENVQLLRDELKSYACRYNLVDLGEFVKEVLKSYEVSESIEQLQVSETISQVPEEGSNDDAHSLSSTTGVPKSKPKPKSVNNSVNSAAKESALDTTQKSNSVSRVKAPVNKKMIKQGSVLEAGNKKLQKNSNNNNKSRKQESNKGTQKAKTEGMKPTTDEEAQLNTSPEEAVLEENKENLDAPVVEDISIEA